MRCYKCNSTLDENDYCIRCGADVSVYKVVVKASNSYYNQGLLKAGVRDLSGAVSCLKTSISINKNNIKARNLLGLVYYEMGEVVMALSEWVVSKNIKEERNVADTYIKRVQSNPNKLEAMNQAVKKYNISLEHAKNGDCDIALIQLKKLVNANPKFIKAALLLSLLYMKDNQNEKAQKTLNKVLKVDRNNTLALRYMAEIETGGKEPDDDDEGFAFKRKKSRAVDGISGNDVIIPRNSYKEPSSGVFTVLSILLGVVIGAAMIWYLVVPAKLANVNYDNNLIVKEYSERISENAIDIANLKQQIENLTKERDSLSTELEIYAGTNGQSKMYSLLIDATNAYVSSDFATAVVLLQKIDIALLPTQTAKDVFNTMYENLAGGASRFRTTGVKAYTEGDYISAINNLAAALCYDSADDEAAYFMYVSYEAIGETEKAYEGYLQFAEQFPESAYLTDVVNRMNILVPPETETAAETTEAQ